MKKLLLASVLCIALVLTSTLGFAATVKDFTNIGGANSKVTVSTKGVTLAGKCYYPTNAVGMITNRTYSTDNFTCEITLNKLGASSDNWFSIQFVDKKAYFDVNDSKKAAGQIFLFRYTKPDFLTIQALSLYAGESWAAKQTDILDYPTGVWKPGAKVKISFKKDPKQGYALYINDKRVKSNTQKNADDLDFTYMKGKIPAKAYVGFGVSDQNVTNETSITVNTINGTKVK